jgi:hypothetical protein
MAAIIEEIENNLPSSMPFTIQSRHNWLVLDIEGNNPNRGAKVITWPKHGGSNQLWIYRDGYIESCLNGLVLDIDGASKNAEVSIIMWEKNGGDNQKWTISANGQIVSKLNGFVLDVCGARIEPAGRIISFPPHGADNQKWNLHGHFAIKSQLNSLFLGVEYASDGRGSGSNVITTPQMHTWIYHEGYIECAQNGLVLDVNGANREPCAQVILWTKNNGANQKWSFTPDGCIVSELTGFVLDIDAGQTTEGARIICYPRHCGSNQRWKIGSP